jgi:catechol 2,3-dioxygenase-like lactoylglutathione lyase family enzyme
MNQKAPLIDCIMVAVGNLHSAAEDFERVLGFPPAQRDHHSDDGTARVVFALGNTALEVLSPATPGTASDALSTHLDRHGESLFGIAFGVEKLDEFVAQLRARGVATTPPFAGGNSNDRSDRELLLPAHHSRGIHTVVRQHDSLPERSTACVEGHAIHAVDHIVINTARGDAAADFYGKLLGIRLALHQNMPQWGGDMRFFRTSHMSIEVIANPKHNTQRDSLWGIAFSSREIEATRQRLIAAGVNVSALRDGRKTATRVCTIKSHCCGIPTLLLGSAD